MICVDGNDNSGKSTLVEYIKQHSSIPVLKPFYPKKNQLKYYLQSPKYYENYYLERYYISELVYPRFKSNRVLMEDYKQFLIEANLSSYGAIILYVKPSRETIINNFKNRGDEYVEENEIDKMIYNYDLIINRSTLPIFKYNYEKDNIKYKLEEIEDFYNKGKEKINLFKQFLSSGNFFIKNSIMFIGEDPSITSVGNGFIKAFISDTGSSLFLHKCLYEAKIYPYIMPYFTNWGKGYDNDKYRLNSINKEIELLKPRKIICLDKNIRNKIGIGEILEHPSYVKRFHSKDYTWYLEKIKNLTE